MNNIIFSEAAYPVHGENCSKHLYRTKGLSVFPICTICKSGWVGVFEKMLTMHMYF